VNEARLGLVFNFIPIRLAVPVTLIAMTAFLFLFPVFISGGRGGTGTAKRPDFNDIQQ